MGLLSAMYNYLAGIEPLGSGMSHIKINSYPGSPELLNLDYHTPCGKMNSDVVAMRVKGDSPINCRTPLKQS